MARREISPAVIGRVKALAASGMSNKRIATNTGVSRDTVKRYLAGERPESAPLDEVRAEETGNRLKIRDNVETFLVKASNIASTDEFVDRMSRKPKDLLVGIGIATEKMELLSGRATSRSESLKIELVAGGSLRELAERTMSARLPLPRRTDIVPLAIDAPVVTVQATDGVRTQPKRGQSG